MGRHEADMISIMGIRLCAAYTHTPPRPLIHTRTLMMGIFRLCHHTFLFANVHSFPIIINNTS